MPRGEIGDVDSGGASSQMVGGGECDASVSQSEHLGRSYNFRPTYMSPFGLVNRGI